MANFRYLPSVLIMTQVELNIIFSNNCQFLTCLSSFFYKKRAVNVGKNEIKSKNVNFSLNISSL